jgi:glycosyltransferase A (GT-A) superfamily protein (DUF2064 family)
MTTIAVIAKECVPGRVKTRLTPPFTPDEAARLAAASLDDTLETVAALPAARRVLYFEGEQPPASARGFEIVPQVQGDLDVRLGQLFDLVEGPLLLVGMDTPQLRREHVEPALSGLGGAAAADADADADCWLGIAADGGFWALAMREPQGDLIRGVTMSRDDTGALQRRRLEDAGLVVAELPMLADVDSAADAASVAASAPATRFAAEYRRLRPGSAA